jgi:hypothetical protein
LSTELEFILLPVVLPLPASILVFSSSFFPALSALFEEFSFSSTVAALCLSSTSSLPFALSLDALDLSSSVE